MKMSASNPEENNLTCAVCEGIYMAPISLSCNHKFCRTCLQGLSGRYENFLPCPVCRKLNPMPPGGVRCLQDNFRLAAEATKRARSAECSPLCPAHPEERAIFYCTQCEQALCIRCKLTKHEGHATEDFSDAVTRCKKHIAGKLAGLNSQIRCVKKAYERLKGREEADRSKQAALAVQIQAQYDRVVAMATKHRDQALQNLQETPEKDVATDAKYLHESLKHLLQLQERARLALSTACDAEVLQVDKNLRQKREHFGIDLEVTSTPSGARSNPMRPGGTQARNILDKKFFAGSKVYWF